MRLARPVARAPVAPAAPAPRRALSAVCSEQDKPLQLFACDLTASEMHVTRMACAREESVPRWEPLSGLDGTAEQLLRNGYCTK